MDDLQTIKVGGLTKDSDTSSPTQITSYVNSIVNVDNVALGCKEDGTSYPDIKSKAKGCSVAIGRNSQAETFGVSIGEKAYSKNCAFALGADAYAEEQGATAIGRYAKATASGAMQLNGNCNSKGEHIAVNNEANTLKFYAGGNNNVTIVDAAGKIPLATVATKVGTTDVGSTTNPIYLNKGVATAITSYTGNVTGNLTGNVTGNVTGDVTGNCSGSSGSCTGNSDTATKLTTSAGSTTQPIYFSDGKPTAITGAIANDTTGKASTAGTADNANALNNGASLGATVKIGDITYTIGTTTIVDASSETKTVLTLTPVV